MRLLDSVVEAPRLQNIGSVVVAQGPSCSRACGILPDQRLSSEIKPRGLIGHMGEPPGKPQQVILNNYLDFSSFNYKREKIIITVITVIITVIVSSFWGYIEMT